MGFKSQYYKNLLKKNEGFQYFSQSELNEVNNITQDTQIKEQDKTATKEQDKQNKKEKQEQDKQDKKDKKEQDKQDKKDKKQNTNKDKKQDTNYEDTKDQDNKNISQPVKTKIAAFVSKIRELKEIKENKQNDTFCKKNKLMDKLIVTKYKKYSYTYISTPLGRAYSIFSIFKKASDASSNILMIYPNAIEFYENNYNKLYDSDLPFQFKDDLLDVDWFNSMNMYIKNLSVRDKFNIHGYTFHGDVFVNKYLRGVINYTNFKSKFNNDVTAYTRDTYFPLFYPILTYGVDLYNQSGVLSLTNMFSDDVDKNNLNMFTTFYASFLPIIFNNLDKIPTDNVYHMYTVILKLVPYIKQNHLIEIIKTYISQIQTVIQNAPPLTKKMIVFRGVRDDYYFRNRKNIYFKNKGFISTSIDHRIALAPGFIGTNCCFTQITLLPGTKMLWISGLSKIPTENEFLLGQDTTYLIRSHKEEYYPQKRLVDENICDIKNKKLMISKVVAL
jgi:hypothetical protein